ncbi:MAG: M67 family metallopeptidase [Thermomicrobiales bacterium]
MLPLAVSGSARHSQAIRTLVMTSAQRDAILDHLRAALPNEGVALLAVKALAADGRAEVAHIFPGTNIEASPYRFTMDPMEVVSADREMRRRNWVLGAIAHSHVASPASPSATDLREAFYPAALLLIVSFTGHAEGRSPEFGAWRIDSEGGERTIVQVPIQVRTGGLGRDGE